MHTIGIIGGIGPESTIEYYRLIISSYLQQDKSGNYPQIVINSINMKKMLDLIGENRLNELADYLVAEVQKVASAGADFALLASNTPHIVFHQINQTSPLPLISIVEVACEKAISKGMQRVGLFGTKFTMQGGFYDQLFSDHGIAVISPDEKDQDYIHNKYMGELVKGIIREDTKKELLKIANKLKENEGIQGLILGGTELPLILKETDANEILFLDTTRIHVESIMKRLA
ncbi:aspartate/glutamate racemase family protein [Thermodesulfobacteriota bacterium]